jgi:hypothetical protein
MNLLCPLCQKMLTVEEKYAGQMMKCPLCSGTFTVPGLPSTPAVPPAPPEANPVAGSAETPAAPASTGPAPPASASPEHTPAPSRPQSPQTSTAGYQKVFTVTFNPRVLMFIPPIAVVLIFFLQFFSWLGVYPGGVPAITQNAWQAAFAGYSEDHDLEKEFRIAPSEKELKEPPEKAAKDFRPGASPLSIFYLILFLPTLVVTVGCLVLNYVHVKLPKGVETLLPWRWGIVAAANLLLFLFLALQLLLGFSLENTVRDVYEASLANKKDAKTTVDQKLEAARRGKALGDLHRTGWLQLTVWLHLLAIVCAALVFWSGRHPSRPLPRIDVLW